MQENTSQMPEKSSQPNSKALMITLIVILVVLIVGGGIWVYTLYSKISDVENDLVVKELPKVEKEVEQPNDELENEVVIEPEEEEEEPEPVKPKEDKYYNSTYGFGLTFPAEWDGYKVKEESTKWEGFTAKSLYFGFDAQENLFAISVFTKEQWDKLQDSPDARQVTYLDENSMYVFAWSHAQYLENDEMEKRAQEIGDIIDSFYTDAK